MYIWPEPAVAGQEVHAKLLEEVDDENIPVEYGGKCTKHLYESNDELAVWGLAKKLNEAAGLPTAIEE